MQKSKQFRGLLIGNPVSKSISYVTHNQILNPIGFYEKQLISIENFSEEIALLKKEEIDWLAVTMPFKEKILPYLDAVDPEALEIGAVNTILVKEGGWVGFNTDGEGALNAIEEKVLVKDKKIIIHGAGGTARAIIFEAKKRGAKVFVANRTALKAIALSKRFAIELYDDKTFYDICINATPVGMTIEAALPIPIGCSYLLDTVYNPHETALIRAAKERGIVPIFGREMFAHLSYLQFRLVEGLSLSKERVLETIRMASL
ncbi:MAG: shikimate dehydrogenase [Verrucomicrobia bacterium]|nr:shikimate dehydrogenase [Verrucomicrobiota bacterium]